MSIKLHYKFRQRPMIDDEQPISEVFRKTSHFIIKKNVKRILTVIFEMNIKNVSLQSANFLNFIVCGLRFI